MSRIHQIRISLNNITPPIWRQVLVPSDITLGRLHILIQIVMGWDDDHMHQFTLGAARRGSRKRGRMFVQMITPWGEPTEMDGEDEDAVTLGEVCGKTRSKLTYDYDFGDGWRHTIEVQKILDPDPDVKYPLCQAGKRACPPEDCGGPWGYEGLLEALENPDDEEYADRLEWLGDEFDPEAFDADKVNAVLRRWPKS